MPATPRRKSRPAPDADVWARYRENTARHVMGLARHVEHRVMHQLTETLGFAGLRPSLGPPMALVATRPRSPGELAERLSISAQACGQLIDVIEDGGYVARRPDPNDGRARRVTITARGRRLTGAAVDFFRVLEAAERERIGAEAYDAFADAALALHRAWAAPVGVTGPAAGEARPPALATLSLLSVQSQRRLMEATAAHGHVGLKMSHAQVLPLVGAEGARIGLLARIQDISRQAVSATARDLERLGYVERAAIAGDARGVAIRLTRAGNALIRDSVRALDALDDEIRGAVGARHAEAFARGAHALYRALDLEREIFDDAKGSSRASESLEAMAARLHRELPAADRERLAHLLAAPAAPGTP